MAIKTARELVLLPYTQRTVTERPGGRGGGRDRGERGERGERAERTLSDTIGADAPRDRDAERRGPDRRWRDAEIADGRTGRTRVDGSTAAEVGAEASPTRPTGDARMVTQ